MNAKIKRLFNICGMPNEDILELFEDKNKTFYMEKFADLIINECINVLRTETIRLDSIPGRELSAQTMELAQILINNHWMKN